LVLHGTKGVVFIKNEYLIVDNYVILYLQNRAKEVFETKVSLTDLPKLEELNAKWFLSWSETAQQNYVACCKYLGTVDGKPEYKTIYLHRYLTDAPKNVYVDHINTNTLDNRRDNLRITTNEKNNKHRKSKNTNNTSGYRNVSWNGHKWLVQLQIDGKNVVLGKFDDVDEAGKFAEEMRKKYYGEFAGFD
jgi:hypothetical protein